jgi:hypothetical protein
MSFKVGDLCQYVPHHPALGVPKYPVRIVRITNFDSHPSYWVTPIGPEREVKKRDGRIVIERPSHQTVVGESELRPCSEARTHLELTERE